MPLPFLMSVLSVGWPRPITSYSLHSVQMMGANNVLHFSINFDTYMSARARATVCVYLIVHWIVACFSSSFSVSINGQTATRIFNSMTNDRENCLRSKHIRYTRIQSQMKRKKDTNKPNNVADDNEEEKICDTHWRQYERAWLRACMRTISIFNMREQ